VKPENVDAQKLIKILDLDTFPKRVQVGRRSSFVGADFCKNIDASSSPHVGPVMEPSFNWGSNLSASDLDCVCRFVFF
jgi:hypothetical protein